MLRSMTGYGRGECTLYDRKVVVEIKSVNHRYGDITLKIPRLMNPLEEKLRKKISSHILRGKVDVYVSLEAFSKDDVAISLNEPLADAYVKVLQCIQSRYNLQDSICTSLVAKFPDVVSVERNVQNDQVLQQIWEALSTALDLALQKFITMRQTEGQALAEDIAARISCAKAGCSQLKERAPAVIEEYTSKLRKRMDELLGNLQVDEGRLLTEVAVFADRTCIDEEITRLESHILQMLEVLQQPHAIGRKLDFLTQEMNREVNTIGSKSNDITLTRVVVDLKSEIEKIREQVQNIE